MNIINKFRQLKLSVCTYLNQCDLSWTQLTCHMPLYASQILYMNCKKLK